MIRRTLLGAAVVAILMLLVTSRPVAAQGLASIAAAASSVSMEKKPGCWACQTAAGAPACAGGNNPGYFNCIAVFGTPCSPSSYGCGTQGSLPVDPDGSAQYVSRGSRIGVPVVILAGDPTERRNCDGVIVARVQSPDDIASVRTRTGALTL